MQTIRVQYSGLIRTAIAGTEIRESLVAALAANETSGNPNVTRYEGAELGRFAQVLGGKVESYQGITKPQMMTALKGVYTIESGVLILINLCTSWGLTQIMGWQALKGGYPVSELSLPSRHYPHTAELLAAFQRDFHLATDNYTDFARSLFTCWNAGSPAGKTTDPNYAARGVARMQIYDGLT